MRTHQHIHTHIHTHTQDAYDDWCDILKSLNKGDELTIRDAYVSKNKFVSLKKQTSSSNDEEEDEEVLGPLKTNHPKRLSLFAGDHHIRIWRKKVSNRSRNTYSKYSTLLELQPRIPVKKTKKRKSSEQITSTTKKTRNRKYNYCSLSSLQIGMKLNNFYGIVVNFTLPKQTKGTDLLMRINVIDSVNELRNNNTQDITQSSLTEITIFSKQKPWRFPSIISSGDIIRIHRASMSERGCFVSMSKFGSAVVVDVETEEVRSTSVKYDWTEQDKEDVLKYKTMSRSILRKYRLPGQNYLSYLSDLRTLRFLFLFSVSFFLSPGTSTPRIYANEQVQAQHMTM